MALNGNNVHAEDGGMVLSAQEQQAILKKKTEDENVKRASEANSDTAELIKKESLTDAISSEAKLNVDANAESARVEAEASAERERKAEDEKKAKEMREETRIKNRTRDLGEVRKICEERGWSIPKVVLEEEAKRMKKDGTMDVGASLNITAGNAEPVKSMDVAPANATKHLEDRYSQQAA